MTPRQSRRAFTIIELLVVVSIMALLMAILLPSLARAKQEGHKAACGANIRGMGQAFQMYLSDSEGMVPANGIVLPKIGGNSKDPAGQYTAGEPDMQKWDLPYGAIWKYTSENRKLYLCPTDAAAGLVRTKPQQLVRGSDGKIGIVGQNPLPPNAAGYWSYSVNTVLNPEGQFRNNYSPRGGTGKTGQPWIDPIKVVNIKNPMMIFFVEEGNGDPWNSNFNDEVFEPPAYNGSDYLTDRHNRGGHVGFMDGHVEWFSAVLFNIVPSAGASVDDFTAMKSPYTRMFFPDGGAFVSK